MMPLDQHDMLGRLAALPTEAAQAYAFARSREWTLPTACRHIVICGMGGSGISGEILRSLCFSQASLPITVCRSDRLPRFVDQHTLVIAISYSGTTQETLDCVQTAIQSDCPLLALTGGGPLADLVHGAGGDIHPLSQGHPPRSALGEIFFALAGLLSFSHPLGIDPLDLERAIARLQARQRQWHTPDEDPNVSPWAIARALHHRFPLIFGSSPVTEAIAYRWKCQLNENSKQHALFNCFPELSHNEVVNLVSNPPERAIAIALRDPSESNLVRRQIDATLELLTPNCGEAIILSGEGEGMLERLLDLLYLGDYVSLYLAFLRGVDPTPIDPIVALKKRLAGVLG